MRATTEIFGCTHRQVAGICDFAITSSTATVALLIGLARTVWTCVIVNRVDAAGRRSAMCLVVSGNAAAVGAMY